jgi:catechol 2,3-dioxygenase-like lactoylglutathione lyase family enzyme
MTTPALAVEVITLPVSHVDRALRFYVDRGGALVSTSDRVPGRPSVLANWAPDVRPPWCWCWRFRFRPRSRVALARDSRSRASASTG